MAEIDTTCLRIITSRLEVEVHPTYSGNEKLGIKEILNGLLLRNNESFNGVLLAYWNVVIQGNKASILRGLTPYIHVNLTAKMLVFSPTVGSFLVGKVNQIGREFLGLLVMGVFNASILLQNANERFNYSSSYIEGSNSSWVCVDDDEHKIEVGSNIFFQVHKIQLKDDFMDMEGSLNFPSSGLITFTPSNPNHEKEKNVIESNHKITSSSKEKVRKKEFMGTKEDEKEEDRTNKKKIEREGKRRKIEEGEKEKEEGAVKGKEKEKGREMEEEKVKNEEREKQFKIVKEKDGEKEKSKKKVKEEMDEEIQSMKKEEEDANEGKEKVKKKRRDEEKEEKLKEQSNKKKKKEKDESQFYDAKERNPRLEDGHANGFLKSTQDQSQHESQVTDALKTKKKKESYGDDWKEESKLRLETSKEDSVIGNGNATSEMKKKKKDNRLDSKEVKKRKRSSL